MPWKKGQSGNPAGRPPGWGKVEHLRARLAEHIPEVVAKLVEQAQAGDTGAARLLLERVVPPLRGVDLPVTLPGLLTTTSLADAGRAVVQAAGAGVLSPEQAARLLDGLGAQARLVEMDELVRRIEALEERTATEKR